MQTGEDGMLNWINWVSYFSVRNRIEKNDQNLQKAEDKSVVMDLLYLNPNLRIRNINSPVEGLTPTNMRTIL